MARAIIGTGSGYGSSPKVRLDDDCGATKPCGYGSGGPGGSPDDPGTGELDHLPILSVMLRQRVAYDIDGVPEFDWVALSTGKATLYEVREEWDAVAGATVVKASMIIPNTKHIDMVPETAVIMEAKTDYMWAITAATVTVDRITVVAYRVWREVPGPGPVFDMDM